MPFSGIPSVGDTAVATVTVLRPTDEETTHQKSRVTCLESHSWYALESDSKPGQSPPTERGEIGSRPGAMRQSPSVLVSALPVSSWRPAKRSEEGHRDLCGHRGPSDSHLLKPGVRTLRHGSRGRPLLPIKLARLDTIPLSPS